MYTDLNLLKSYTHELVPIKLKPNASLIAAANPKDKISMICSTNAPNPKKSGRFLTKGFQFFQAICSLKQIKNPSWTSINSTRGVTHAVTLDGKYRPILNEIVEELKNRCTEAILDFGNKIEPGDQLKIKQGPFSDFICHVEILTLNNVIGQSIYAPKDKKQNIRQQSSLKQTNLIRLSIQLIDYLYHRR